ncbi:DUF2306 domain-containing protein, partial [Amycolatopsis lurida]
RKYEIAAALSGTSARALLTMIRDALAATMKALPQKGFTVTSSRRPGWLLPTGLVLLSLVPAVAGVSRLTQLGSGVVTEDNARFFAMPIPVVLHIIGATVFCLLGAFQFAPRFRAKNRGWHRVAGRIVLPCGIIAALSGMWMTLFSELPAKDGTLLGVFRIFFGAAMAASLVLGFLAVRRRDFAQHRAWVMRGYAIGLGAGTQVFTLLPWALAFGTPGVITHALLMAAGWMINLAVAEHVIRRTRRPVIGGYESVGDLPTLGISSLKRIFHTHV